MEGPAFFRLPIELRLHIYRYALYDRAAITIGSAQLVGSPPDIVHKLYVRRLRLSSRSYIFIDTR